MNTLCTKLFLRRTVTAHAIRLTAGRKYGEDREFVLRFLAEADGVCYVPFVGYVYRYFAASAIEKPRTDHIQRLVEQFDSDRERFASLGMDEERFRRTGSECWGTRIVAVFGAVEQKMRGRERRRTMRMYLRDPQLHALLRQMDLRSPHRTRFERMMLGAIDRRSAPQVRAVLRAMRCRVRLHEMFGKGSGA